MILAHAPYNLVVALSSLLLLFAIHWKKDFNKSIEKEERFREEYDLIIIGAGLSGAIIAEQASSRSGLTSLILEKRDHIGGNCYDFINKHGIRVSRYGAHIFHTKHSRVWDYIQKFSTWIPYSHRVKGFVKDHLGQYSIVPIPPNQETVNQLFSLNISSVDEMSAWLDTKKPENCTTILDGEQMSKCRVGQDLYEKIFKEYTKKQWDKYPKEMDPSVLARLPVRLDRNDNYFNDPYEALPENGYTEFFEKILLNDPKIDVRLNTDFFNVRSQLPKHKLLIFTGPIDAFYAGLGWPKLEYRSIFFKIEYHEPPNGFYQPSWVVNYPGAEFPWTRIAEYKHMPNQPKSVRDGSVSGTVIYKEFSTDHGDPYYPVPNEKNRALYRRYQDLALQEPKVVFVGRLASYKYFNMDEAILNALEMYDKILLSGTLDTFSNGTSKACEIEASKN